jgi:hypothetical protein
VKRCSELILLCLFVAFGFWLQKRIPFYSAWDMELITIIDLFRMSADLLPQHINHTAFGMYLPMRALWNILPLPTSEMGQWLSHEIPLLMLREPVLWMRNSSILAALALIIATYKPQRILSLLLVLITLPSLWLIPLQTIRTELYAIMWYAIAFAFLTKTSKRRNSYLFFFFAGLGFVTKYQGVFLHLGLCLLYLFHFSPAQYHPMPDKSKARWVLGLFLFLSFCSLLAYIPSTFAVFSRSNFPNIFFFAALFILLLPFFKSPYFRLFGFLWWTGLGIIATFSLHFVLGLSLETSWEYLLFDWKMIFFRHSNPNIALPRVESIFGWSLFHQGPLLLIWVICWLKDLKKITHFHKILSTAYFFLILSSFRLVTRGGLQDAIWNDFLILFGFSFFQFKKESYYSIAFVALTILNLWTLKNLPFQTQYAGQYDIDRYWQEPYESPEILYTEKMKILQNRRREINQKIKLKL